MKSWRIILCVLVGLVALPLKAQEEGLSLPARPDGPYEIRGVVVDATTGQPLSEVELTIQENAQPSNPPFETAESGANGAFRFANLSEGKYTIQASRQGYAAQAYLQHENFWTGIAVGPGKDSIHLRFGLSPSATITGQVTDENGEGVRGAEVILWTERLSDGARGITAAGNTRTDDEGRYRLEHLLAGKYSVSVTAAPWYSRYVAGLPYVPWRGGVPGGVPGGQNSRAYAAFPPRGGIWPSAATDEGRTTLPDVVYPTLYYPNSRDWQGMEWIKVQAGQVENADFHLQPEPSVHIQLQLSENESAGHMPAVNFFRELPGGGRVTAPYVTVMSGNGVMEVSGLAAGRYNVQMSGPESNNTWTGQEIDVQGTSQMGLQQPSGNGPVIQGQIRTTDGAELGENVTLRLRDAQGHDYLSSDYSPPSAQGRPKFLFRFEDLPTGPHAYEFAMIQPAGVVVKQLEGKGAKISGMKIETDGTQEVNLEVSVAQAASTVEGVALRDGKPFMGAMILLMPEDRKEWERLARRDQSDSDGTFRLQNVAPGKYILFALENGWDLEWSKAESLEPFVAKAQILEMGERQFKSVKLEVQ